MINIDKIFLERDLKDSPRANSIISHFSHLTPKIIDRYDEIFGKVKKPYLQKRQSVSLFIANKKGNLVKEAPEAYGTVGEKHFYFIHAFNCIYECEYCYLQGYFHSPDLVLFINHEDIIKEIKDVASQHPNDRIWFHAGEFSDSLALTHLTGELQVYFDFFRDNSNLIMELRTKSDNIDSLLSLSPVSNIITSYSLAPKKNLDYKAPTIDERLQAISRLHRAGFPIGIHLDPITPSKNFNEVYSDLLYHLNEAIPLKEVQYFSLGVTRFPENIYHQVKKNYPQSILFNEHMLKDKNGIVRSPRPIRFPLMENIKQQIFDYDVEKSKIYLCME